jgi:hypothetical protein
MHTEPTQVAGDPTEHGRVAEPGGTSFLRANAVTLTTGTLAIALAGFVWFQMPHEREISSLWVFLFKLTPFVAAGIAIAWLDLGWAHRLRLHLVLIPACFLTFFCFFVPRIFYYRSITGPEHYYTILTLVPFMILAFVLAYRLGGGPRSMALRLCFALIILQLSGLEDLAFFVTNPHPGGWASIPQVWDWANHIRVRLGHYPTRNEAFAFIGVHVALALITLTLPGSVVGRILNRPRRRRAHLT